MFLSFGLSLGFLGCSRGSGSGVSSSSIGSRSARGSSTSATMTGDASHSPSSITCRSPSINRPGSPDSAASTSRTLRVSPVTHTLRSTTGSFPSLLPLL